MTIIPISSLTDPFVTLLKQFCFITVSLAVLLTYSSAAHSSNTKSPMLKVAYKNFYTHLRKLDPQTLPRLHFAFGFVLPESKALCPLDEVFIHTPKKDIPIAIFNTNRFSLPRERALKLADAEVYIRFKADFFEQHAVTAEACDLSVRLEADLLQHTTLSVPDLQALNADFKTFFDNMGIGLFSFMMPETQGIKIHLQPSNTTDGDTTDKPEELFHGVTIANGVVFLDDNWIGRNQQALDLSHVSHITAWLDK